MWLRITKRDVEKAIKARELGSSIARCCPVFQAANRAFPNSIMEVTNTSVWVRNRSEKRYALGVSAQAITVLPEYAWKDIRPKRIFVKGLERLEKTK